jgi:hypothetical protein
LAGQIVAMTQAEAKRVIDYVEAWFGEKLTYDFALNFIGSMPSEQADVLVEGWPDLETLREPGNLPQVKAGRVRPVVPGIGGVPPVMGGAITRSSQLLTYVDEVVMDAAVILPPWEPATFPEDIKVPQLGLQLALLADARPAIEADALLLADKRYRMNAEREDLVQAVIAYGDFREPSAFEPGGPVRSLIDQLAGSIDICRTGEATPLAISSTSRSVLTTLLGGEQLAATRRAHHLTLLANLEMPKLIADPRLLIELRASTELTSFRLALRGALDLIADIPEDASGEAAAQVAIAEDLKSSLSALERAVSRSPALSALRSGTRDLSFMGLGAGTGAAAAAMTGSPTAGILTGLVSGTTSKVLAAASDYIEAARSRREANRIWDVVTAFELDSN